VFTKGQQILFSNEKNKKTMDKNTNLESKPFSSKFSAERVELSFENTFPTVSSDSQNCFINIGISPVNNQNYQKFIVFLTTFYLPNFFGHIVQIFDIPE